MDEKNFERDLFYDEEAVEITKSPEKKLKEKIAPAEPIVELVSLPSACVFYLDILKPLLDIAESKNINIYVYKRSRGGRYHSPNRCYYGIYAVPCGIQKASQAKSLAIVLASISDYPAGVNPSKSSKQYRLLQNFLAKLSSNI